MDDDTPMPEPHMFVSVGALRALLEELGHDDDEVEAAFKRVEQRREELESQFERGPELEPE